MGTPKKDTNNVSVKNSVEQYGRVILTLKNCLLPEEKISSTPTQIDGLDAETEMDLRILGCELIQTAGILLKLPQVAMATAQVLFQRFYYSKSFVRQSYEVTGMGCLYLASKIEEAPRRIRDVINVYHHIKQLNSQKTLTPMILDLNYIQLKYQVIKAERRVLKELGFCVHVKHPHKLIVIYLQVLGMEKNHQLMQVAWNYMNDSLRTDVFVRYQPETVACACIYLTARRAKLPLPKSPPWYHVFKVDEKDIQDVALRILRLYIRPKPKVEVLEKKVQEVCKKFEENKLRSKNNLNSITSGNNTPSSPHVPDKKTPKRSKSRSRSISSSPRHKKSRKYAKRGVSRSRSRSRSYDRKYKKKSSRRSRSASPVKRYKEKSRYRSRSRSYDRDRDYYSSSSNRKRSEERYKKSSDKYYNNKDEDGDSSVKKYSSSNNNNNNSNSSSNKQSSWSKQDTKTTSASGGASRQHNSKKYKHNNVEKINNSKHKSDNEDDDDDEMIIDDEEDEDVEEVQIINVKKDKKR